MLRANRGCPLSTSGPRITIPSGPQKIHRQRHHEESVRVIRLAVPRPDQADQRGPVRPSKRRGQNQPANRPKAVGNRLCKAPAADRSLLGRMRQTVPNAPFLRTRTGGIRRNGPRASTSPRRRGFFCWRDFIVPCNEGRRRILPRARVVLESWGRRGRRQRRRCRPAATYRLCMAGRRTQNWKTLPAIPNEALFVVCSRRTPFPWVTPAAENRLAPPKNDNALSYASLRNILASTRIRRVALEKGSVIQRRRRLILLMLSMLRPAAFLSPNPYDFHGRQSGRQSANVPPAPKPTIVPSAVPRNGKALEKCLTGSSARH